MGMFVYLFYIHPLMIHKVESYRQRGGILHKMSGMCLSYKGFIVYYEKCVL